MSSLPETSLSGIVNLIKPPPALDMLELTSLRKQKINLADYSYQQDLESRFFLSDLSTFDLSVLEEILFSPLKISVKKLSRALDCTDSDLHPILRKLSACGLVQWQGDTLQVDKERRKHFEFQITRFEEDFKPDMEFLQGLLRQIPIPVQPLWYSIPRSSNNIFESIVEKYLLTPQIYQRYLAELHFPDPTLNAILADVLASPDLKLSSSDLIAKYNLKRQDFDLLMLQLELHFACFVVYHREEDHWIESVMPLHEWRQYLFFLRDTEAPKLQAESVTRFRPSDYSFLEDMATVLASLKKKPLPIESPELLFTPSSLKTINAVCGLPEDVAPQYLSKVARKLLLIKLATIDGNKLHISDAAADWLDLTIENRALHLYRHPLNRLLTDSPLLNEKNLREAEKSVKRALHGEWVFFDDFVNGSVSPLSEEAAVMLKKSGKNWRYTLPIYGEEEQKFLKMVIFEWLFECGFTATGKKDGRDCFVVTPFGQFFFED